MEINRLKSLIRSLTSEEDVSKVYSSFESEIEKLNEENGRIRRELKAMREHQLNESLISKNGKGVSASHGGESFLNAVPYLIISAESLGSGLSRYSSASRASQLLRREAKENQELRRENEVSFR